MYEIIADMMIGLKYFLIYMFTLAGVIFLINKLFRLPKELFRKLLHFIAFSSVIVMIYTAKNWISAALVPTIARNRIRSLQRFDLSLAMIHGLPSPSPST